MTSKSSGSSERPPGRTAAIAMSGVTKAFDDTPAVTDVEFSIYPGEVVLLVGHNGSGKTTLLRIISGLAKADRGSILIYGAKPGSLDARSVLSVAFDTPALYDDLTTFEHLKFSATLSLADDAEQRANRLLEVFGLASVADRFPATFSRGMKQKVSLGMAFARPHKVMMIDEPFVGLDQSGKLALVNLISEEARKGVAFLVASHSTDLVEVASRSIAISSGEIVFDGDPVKGRDYLS